MGRVFVFGYMLSTRTPPTCPNRHVGGISRFSTPPTSQTRKRIPFGDAFSSLATFLPPDTTNVPNGHVSGVRQVLHPSLQADTKTRSHMGRVFVSAYIPSRTLPTCPIGHVGVPFAHQSTPSGRVLVFEWRGHTPICAVSGTPSYFSNEVCRFRHVSIV
jgi:hypothetical protein